MDTVVDLFRAKEAWLMERILFHATAHGYTAYTSTLIEAWRASIAGLTEAIAQEVQSGEGHGIEMSVDTDLTQDPVARFGLVEARRHRERGVPLGMFLGLFTYYRQSYQDCLKEFLPAGTERDQAEHTIVRLFDRMGAAFCVAWASEGESTVMTDMAATLRTMTNEKNRYLTFLESLADPVILLDPSGCVDLMNRAAAVLINPEIRPGQAYYENRLHSQAKSWRGRPVGELFPWLEEFSQGEMVDSGTDMCRWMLLSTPDKAKIFRAVFCKEPDVSGKFTGFSLVLHDETEQQMANLQIARAKEELERTFDTISDLVFFVDTQHVMLRVNRALARRVGLEPREIVGRTCRDVLGCARCFCTADDFSPTTTPVSFPHVRGRFLITRNALVDAAQETIGHVFVARDVTHLEQIQATLQAVENKYKNIFDHAQEGIFQSTPEGKFLSLNPAMARIFGFESTEEMRDYYTDIAAQMYVHPQDRDKLIRDGLAMGYVANREIQLKRRDGSVFWTRVGGRIVRDSDGEMRYFEGFLQDVNERKKLESQLLQTQKLEAVGQLAAGIAHEINTPAQYVLNNVWFIKDAVEKIAQGLQGHGRLLEELAVHPHLAGDIERLQAADKELQLDFFLAELPAAIAETVQGLDRITAIVRSVKQFAHPGHAQAQPANLNDLVRDTVNVSRNEWKYVADLTTDLDPDLPPVPCLVHEIGQVLLNLIINAAHAVADKNVHGSDRGVIAVSTRLVGDWVEIRIRDSGTGIPEHARDHVFEPFFTTKAVGKGTGQGLYLAHRTVVAQHGGRLNFETESGRGTTFVVALPVAGVAGDNAHGL